MLHYSYSTRNIELCCILSENAVYYFILYYTFIRLLIIMLKKLNDYNVTVYHYNNMYCCRGLKCPKEGVIHSTLHQVIVFQRFC